MFSDDVREKESQLILSSLLSVRSKIRRQSLSILSCPVVQKRPFYYRFYHQLFPLQCFSLPLVANGRDSKI